MIIEGGRPLLGCARIQGSKNAALPMMAAAILHEGEVALHNCPRIADVFSMERILQSLGAETCWEDHTLRISCRNLRGYEIDREDAASMRSSVMLMGSLLGRQGRVRIAHPGGCTIGARPIDLHLGVFRAMGAVVEEQGEMLEARTGGELFGTRICFPISSVGATENGILAAVKARGTTLLENCALEPEITHLCHFLQAMGAEIGGIGTRKLRIRGVRILRDVRFAVPPDRIVAGTYLYAAAATRGKVTLSDAPVEEISSILRVYEKMGGQWEYNGGKLIADASGVERMVKYTRTQCYPGFPTDMQSVLMAVLLTIPGKGRIREEIFEDRLKTAGELKKLGGQIHTAGRDAWITGGEPLTGARVEARDLRGGAALAVAALAASGTTVIGNAGFVERGYEAIDADLTALGGRIRRIP
ncbi:MAG TPA: UDP-N-acetylglucosamine 1-carboxyvinyltransferase [Candidatus Pullilachnospira intestinigallinarum]|nr:UDP-N-acetylglucosamine 1-carboxyvinyltransferase [Candidatus Pullilachnospira intestinigallinarum]